MSVTEEEMQDLEPIVPIEKTMDVDGHKCRVKRLKTREFLSLLQVLTSGLGPALGEVKLDFTDGETVGRDLSALMLLAVPNAIDEFTVFLRNVVEPVDEKDRAAVATYLLDNPDPEVLLDIFEAIATQEKDDLAGLGGKAQAMWSRLMTVYAKK